MSDKKLIDYKASNTTQHLHSMFGTDPKMFSGSLILPFEPIIVVNVKPLAS
jgi:hypothetical protein